MNRRELYRQMRAAEIGTLPPGIDDIGFLGLFGKLLGRLDRTAVRVGAAAGLVLGTLVFIATGLLDRQVWGTPADAAWLWLLLCAVHVVFGVAAGGASALLFALWMFVRGQLWHRRYDAAVIGGMVAGLFALALGGAVWADMGARFGPGYGASPRGMLLALVLGAAGVWIGRSVQAVLGVWRSRGLHPPLVPVRRPANAAWRGIVLVLAFAVVAWDLDMAHVPRSPPRDVPGAETVSLSREHHVILLGIDGLGWADVRAGIGDGSLENWDTLERTGARGRMYAESGYGPAAFWTTVATGVTAQQHGVRSLVQPRVAGMARPIALAGEHVGFRELYGPVLRTAGLSSPVPVSRASIRRWCAWEIVRQAGGEAGVVGWWGAWPGAGESGTLDMPALLEGSWHANAPLAIDVRVGEGLRATLHRTPRPSLTMAYFPGLDLLRRGAADGADPGQVEAHRRLLDALIGEAAASLGPEDLLLVVADRGGRRADALMFSAHEDTADGVLLAFGSGVSPGTRLSRPRPEDVLPTVAWWLGLPPSADWQGSVWTPLRPGRPFNAPTFAYGRPAREHAMDPAFAALRLRQFREAGYLD